MRYLKASIMLVLCLWAGSTFPQSKSDAQPSLPLNSLKVNSSFGFRIHPITHRWNKHTGVDLAASNEPVYAILKGIVIGSGFHPLLGEYIKISHRGIVSTYGHLSVRFVNVGDFVYAGSPVGITGSTGQVTGEHLHFSIFFEGEYLHPLRFLALLIQTAKIKSINPNTYEV